MMSEGYFKDYYYKFKEKKNIQTKLYDLNGQFVDQQTKLDRCKRL